MYALDDAKSHVSEDAGDEGGGRRKKRSVGEAHDERSIAALGPYERCTQTVTKEVEHEGVRTAVHYHTGFYGSKASAEDLLDNLKWLPDDKLVEEEKKAISIHAPRTHVLKYDAESSVSADEANQKVEN